MHLVQCTFFYGARDWASFIEIKHYVQELQLRVLAPKYGKFQYLPVTVAGQLLVRRTNHVTSRVPLTPYRCRVWRVYPVPGEWSCCWLLWISLNKPHTQWPPPTDDINDAHCGSQKLYKNVQLTLITHMDHDATSIISHCSWDAGPKEYGGELSEV